MARIVVRCTLLLLIIALFIGISSLLPPSNHEDPEEPILVTIYDSEPRVDLSTPPSFFQYDTRWSDMPYAEGTIGDSGCGLCAAASAISYMTQTVIDPRDLVDMVGNTCTINGVNDMGKFLSFFGSEYDLRYSDIYWLKAEAREALNNGYLVFAGINGRIGPNFYDGHVVLLWEQDTKICVFDPMSAELTQLSEDYFYLADFIYFYSITGISEQE